MLIGCPSCATLNRVPHERLAQDPKCAENTFDAAVTRTEMPVLVDFWASWCGPCRAMAPAFERAAAGLKARVRFAKLDTEAAPALAGRFGIRSIPTMILFRGAKELQRISGAMDERSIRAWVEQAL